MFTVFHPIEHVYGITGILPSEINHYFSPGGFKIILPVSFAYLMTQEIFSLMSNL